MHTWTRDNAVDYIEGFDELGDDEKRALLTYLNDHFPPSAYESHRDARRRARQNIRAVQQEVESAVAAYPPYILDKDIPHTHNALEGCAVVLTAGGDGERLKQSLVAQGASPHALAGYTKATFPLPERAGNVSTLELNLHHIASIAQSAGTEIPLLVTTGPPGSTTARVIPSLLKEKSHFGLSWCRTLAQQARLHLTEQDKIAVAHTPEGPRPVTHPDETGGPLMRLKKPWNSRSDTSILDELASQGVDRLIILQATAVYHPHLITALAQISRTHDVVGVGIRGDNAEMIASLGVYVALEKENDRIIRVLDPHYRNAAIDSMKDETGTWFLPCNTGLYACRLKTLAQGSLPDFCTSGKEVLPHLPKAPKTGYAATDLMSLSHSATIIVTEADKFAVIKKAKDLSEVARAAKRFGLVK